MYPQDLASYTNDSWVANYDQRDFISYLKWQQTPKIKKIEGNNILPELNLKLWKIGLKLKRSRITALELKSTTSSVTRCWNKN